jgi:putative membrane protein
MTGGSNEDQPSRNDLAEDRTILANERTFAGWMRTSLGTIALGVGFNALFRTMEPDWVPRAIATAFLLLAIFVIIAAERRAAAVMKRLGTHVVIEARPMNLRLLAGVISIGSAALIASIWLIEIV